MGGIEPPSKEKKIKNSTGISDFNNLATNPQKSAKIDWCLTSKFFWLKT